MGKQSLFDVHRCASPLGFGKIFRVFLASLQHLANLLDDYNDALSRK